MMLVLFLGLSLMGEIFTKEQTFYQKVLEDFSYSIGVNVNLCRKQISFSDNMIVEFYEYWNRTVPLNNIEMGCVIKCAFQQLELVTPRLNLKEENAVAFLEAIGANEMMTKAIMELYKLCHSIAKGKTCKMALDIARCFRVGIFQLTWEPKLSMNGVDYQLE